MSQQTPYIGCKISLISMLDIRYEGILHSVNSEKSTIALSKVRSFGTEDRPTVHAVPSRDEVYEYIIFKATDIKDLVVCSSAGPDYDPAIISVSSLPDSPQEQKQSEKKDNVGAVPPPPQQQQWNAVGGSGGPVSVAPSQQPPATRPNGGFGLGRRGAPLSSTGTGGAPSAPADNSDAGPGGARNVPARSGNFPSNNHYSNVQQQHHQRGPRGLPRAYQPQHQSSNGHQQPPHYHQYHHHQPPAHHGGGGVGMNQLAAAVDPRLKFDSDFDFEEANEKFKEQLGAVVGGMANANIDDNAVSLEEIERSAIPSPPPENVGETFYNKKTSFFDNISCESLEKTEGKNTRPDWKKERMTNQETFGHSAVRSLTYQRRGPRGFVGGGAHGYHRHQNQNYFNNYSIGGGGNRNYRNYHQNQQQPRQHQHYGGGHGGGQQQQQYGGPSGDGGGTYHQNNRAHGGGGSGRAGPNGNSRGSGW